MNTLNCTLFHNQISRGRRVYVDLHLQPFPSIHFVYVMLNVSPLPCAMLQMDNILFDAVVETYATQMFVHLISQSKSVGMHLPM